MENLQNILIIVAGGVLGTGVVVLLAAVLQELVTSRSRRKAKGQLLV